MKTTQHVADDGYKDIYMGISSVLEKTGELFKAELRGYLSKEDVEKEIARLKKDEKHIFRYSQRHNDNKGCKVFQALCRVF